MKSLVYPALSRQSLFPATPLGVILLFLGAYLSDPLARWQRETGKPLPRNWPRVKWTHQTWPVSSQCSAWIKSWRQTDPQPAFQLFPSGFLFPKHTISASCPNTDGTPAVQGPVLIRPSAQGKPERSRHNGKVRLIIHSNDPLAPLWRNRACTSRPWEKRAADESGWFLAMQAILWL